ncbi:hypothetical protein K458DRAFT_481534 [Lentithecium fluviatile CBS 122367]|uniref:Uncharacterized protein n=1 Tax=Lentithecium fluviatile CBS 122367 TaxID=1168545 RepID=A0A6G1IGY1_9PLEO|nr:hypothetical protein K458DRAFT_481534 [Lentithecium fluviatile CBS 122367]
MSPRTWKIVPDLSATSIQHVPFLNCRKFFAADNSSSTAGSISRSQRAFIAHLRQKAFANKEDAISLWGEHCSSPTKDFDSVRWTCDEGTFPGAILKNPAAVDTIQKSDAWYLLTDGEISNGHVHQLAALADELNILSVPIVFLIVGARGRTPETTNISVGISFFASAQDTVILFKETSTGKIYVVAGKGCFAPLGGSAAAQDLAHWENIPAFDSEESFFDHCKGLDINVVQAESRQDLPKGVSLGPEWERANDGPTWVDLDLLPQAGLLSNEDLFKLFAEEAFNNLAVAYKTRKRTQEIRTFVQAQRMEQVTPKLEDTSGAASIIVRMGRPSTTEEERAVLRAELRQAHAQNREHYQSSIADFASSPKETNLRKRNQLVDAALRTLASIEAAGFNAAILSRRSNRARRAEVVTSDTTVTVSNLDLEGPAYKGYCLVCCGEDEVMSICLKELDAEHRDDNTTDFALNFPLAAGVSAKNANMVSSQNVCFQCALLSPEGLSIYKEPLKAVIPTVRYDGPNKKYINDQLCLALTAGLVTGAAGIAQLFMAILDRVLSTKSWAGAGLDQTQISADELREAVQRQHTFRWMLGQLVENTRTRETFNEVGDWVKFPQALAWAANDFEANSLASFAVTYPAAGFGTLLSLGRNTGAFDVQTMRRLKIAKAVYSVAAKYLADMQKAIQNADHSGLWKQKYLETIYHEFNAPLIPRDLGPESFITDVATFETRLQGRASSSEVEPAAVDTALQALSINNTDTSASAGDATSNEDKQIIMHKTQAILFWLIYQQRSHCTAQTFFSTLTQTQHLAPAVLNAHLTVPSPELRSLLLSIFAEADAHPIDAEAATLHTAPVPFASPFGASVLRCGIAACGAPFCNVEALDAEALDMRTLDGIRQARAHHLVHVFGMQGRFEHSATGLPERTATGDPPTSIHVSLHACIVRAWVEQSPEKRRAVVKHADQRGAFAAEVRKRVCELGRGNVHRSGIEGNVLGVLPSFFEVLRLALRMEGRGNDDDDDDVAVYEHDFERNGVGAKVAFELAAKEL